MISKSGNNGGTYARSDIALEFASWLSPEFKLYVIQEFQFAIRMKWVKPSKYENLIDVFTVQIQSLRNWKSSDNRLKERLKP